MSSITGVKVKKKVRDLWVAALRSGKYRKLRGSLRNEDKGRCCLGVLCDVYRKEVGGCWQGGDFITVGGERNTYVLPMEVAEWAGIDPAGRFAEPKVVDEMFYRGLTTLNDETDLTLRQIADVIENGRFI